MKKILLTFFAASFVFFSASAQPNLSEKLKTYVNQFNADDNEAVINHISNAESYNWLNQNIPLFDFPDKEIEQMYYFRWWSFRKHIKETPEGFIVTEFIEPVKHAARHNAISCALGHHIYESRWLRDPFFIEDYLNFWLYKADVGENRPRFHQFSSWVDDALLEYYKVQSNQKYISSIILDLDKDYDKWEKERLLPNGLFWQHDVKDGMEESVSGGRREENMRPTISSYMYGNAKALVELAKIGGQPQLVEKYEAKAAKLKQLVQDSLWDDKDKFFKTRLEKNQGLHRAREAIGFVPWYFNLPADNKKYADAWKQLTDTAGFRAPWGLTTAERREPTFRTRGSGHGCEWDGPIWPFATTQTLRGLSNLLTNYRHKDGMSADVFYDELHKYAWSQQMYGKPYIGEYQDEKTGRWLKGDHPRSKFYNHSTFMDHVISDLIGLKPQLDNSLRVHPLIPKGKADWFLLENIPYKGKLLKIMWDKTGERYKQGKGFRIYADGKQIAKFNKLKPVHIKL